MPRAARLDILNILQHVIVRGIEKSAIFNDDTDRRDFLRRLEFLLEETGVECLAWAFLSNHVHLLLRPRREYLSTFMRRLLTGYAVGFNRRYNRSGHLFQNRYKSIVCEEDLYLLELVRYIHLNPLRAGIVSDLSALDQFPWTGHPVLMGLRRFEGQAVSEVLGHFGENFPMARKAYRQFLSDGLGQGRSGELTGGALKQGKGGETGNESPVHDTRVLGSDAFVQRIVGGDKSAPQAHRSIPLPDLVEEVARLFGVTGDDLRSPGRAKAVTDARSVVSYLGYKKMGYSGEAVAGMIGITRSGVCRRCAGGERLVDADRRLAEILQVSQQVTSVPD